jgi:hypothetical protein
MTEIYVNILSSLLLRLALKVSRVFAWKRTETFARVTEKTRLENIGKKKN